MRTVGDLLCEYKEKPSTGEDLPVLTLTERNGFVYQSERFNKRLAIEDTSSYKVVHRDDIAFNPYLLWAGAVAQNTIVDAGVISPLYPTFRVREGYDPKYVARLLLTAQMIKAYDQIAFGSVPRRRRSSVKDFLALNVGHIPSLDEQRRIAEILDQADEIRAKRRQQLAHLDTLTQSIFHDIFGRVKATSLACLGDLAQVSSGITKGRSTSDVTREVPYLAVANVQAGYLNLNAVKGIEATEAEIERYRLQKGDLLMTEGGDPDKLGRGTVWQGEIRECIHQNHIFRVRLSESSPILVDYLSSFLGSLEARSYFLRSAKQTTGIASINMTQLRSLPIPLPPLNEQRIYVERIHAVEASRVKIERALAADEELFASLQSRAFRGEL